MPTGPGPDNMFIRLIEELSAHSHQEGVWPLSAALGAVVAAIGDGISIQDRDFRVLYQNQIHRDLLGDHVGEYCYHAYEQSDTMCTGCPLAETFKDGKVHTAERSTMTGKGRVHVEINASPLRDETGGIVAGIEAIRNINSRKEAESALRRERDRVQRYLDVVGVMLVVINADQKITLINKKGCEILGYHEHELIGKNWFDIAIPPALRDEIKSVFTRIISGRMEQVEFHENAVVSKNGEQRTIAWHNSILKDETGNIIGTLSSGEDITARKQAEQAQIESESRYKRLVESVTDYIYSVDVEKGRAVSTIHGPGCVNVTGYTSEEYGADTHLWQRMVFDEDRGAVIAQANRILAGEPVQPFEHRIIHKDGSIRWVRNTPVPRCDNEGRLIAYDGLITDITQLKMLENQLRQAQKMEAVGQLAGGIAHDFNNILTAIIGYANLLLMKMPENDPGRAYTDNILSSAERAAHLTSSLLAFSRKQIIDLKPVSVNNIIRRVEKLLVRVISEDIEFRTRLSSDELTVLADSIQIEHVLMNLATNARDAMPDGGALLVETDPVELGEEFVRTHSYGKPGRYVLISVTDTGIGMDEKVRSRVFEPFFSTKEVGKGTGLGLAMVYGIIKQHDGYIHAYSEPGHGTTFKIHLPLIDSQAEEIKLKRPLAIQRGSETVLLAEDDNSVRKLTRSMLEDFGYKVIEAADGEDAVGKFMENEDRVDLLVLDIIMPKKNGKETYLEIKKARPNIKALFTSGYTANIVHKKGILETGLDFIIKPSTPEDFLKKVREVLDKK